jgi:putative endonuclease
MHYVYALYSKKFDKIYIGYSPGPNKRLASHNDPGDKGWTKKFQPWEIKIEYLKNKTTPSC